MSMSGFGKGLPRLLEKKSRWPSMDRLGAKSAWSVLTLSRFSGVPQGSIVERRLETHMTSRPCPPVRSEEKYSVSPSLDMTAFCSLKVGVFTGAPREWGSPQGENGAPPRACRAILSAALGPSLLHPRTG